MRGINRLTALKVNKLKTPGRYADGGGLWLKISEGGTKSWQFRYSRHGVHRHMGLGPLMSVSLAEARERAKQARQVLLDGRDPIEARRDADATLRLEAARQMTFAEATDAFLSTNSVVWRNDKHRGQWRSTLTTYAFPVFGDLPVKEIDTALVVKALTPIWHAKHETANRVRGRVERVLAWAEAQQLREGENPAAWARLKYLLPLKAKAKDHHPALPYVELPGFMAELRQRDYVSARALEFTVLTASRTNETIGMRWDEIDFDAGLWTIPGSRMKANRPHQVPLSDRCISILKALPRTGDFVFINGGGNAISNMAMLQLLRGMRPGVTTHGFRATFKTWARERTSFAVEVQEAALAHAVADKVEAAYIIGDNMLDKRARLMAEWSKFCGAPAVTATVTPINRVG
jgi:integrase